MITHLVLFRLRPDLKAEQGRTLVEAFATAAEAIPGVRQARVGDRIRFGYAYEAVPQPQHEFMVSLEFNDPAALKEYLTHPTHAVLAARFYEAASEVHAYDFETTIGIAGLSGLSAKRGG